MKTYLKKRLVPFALIASLTLQVDSCGNGGEKDFGFEAQEFLCDEADARLTECCGGTPRLYCTRRYACSHRAPDLSEDDSLCIRESSCAALEAAGACALTDWKSGGSAATGSPLSTATVLRALGCR